MNNLRERTPHSPRVDQQHQQQQQQQRPDEASFPEIRYGSDGGRQLSRVGQQAAADVPRAVVTLRSPLSAALVASSPRAHAHSASSFGSASSLHTAHALPQQPLPLGTAGDQQQQQQQQQQHHQQQQQQQQQRFCAVAPSAFSAHKHTASGASSGGASPFAAGAYPPGPGSVASSAASGRSGQRRTVWAPRSAPNPFVTRFSPVAALLYAAYLAALGFYMWVRVTFTLDMGAQTGYAMFVLAVEFVGVSAVLPYGALLVVYTASRGTRGLPLDDGQVVLPKGKRFHVRVLVPCYKEALSVIVNTVGAALEAELPPGVSRTVYLCDDGRDPEKEAFAAKLAPDVVYVTGRARKPGEINGKSANVNNCLRNVVYGEAADTPDAIPLTELVVVFDADMAAKRHFFLKALEAMWDDDTALCLTPQAFSNISPAADLFNNINTQFWEYVLPGCDAWGYVACTGTNFCIRARALATVGWFPEYTITEDYALSMELKMAGLRGRYLPEYLAVGEAPDEVRNVMRQRSRWTKGHMQIFFSSKCPLIQWRLPLVHKILYTNGTWAYFCTIITTVTFVMIPFNSLVFNLQPVLFTKPFVLAATTYLPTNFLLMSYVRSPRHVKGMWFAQVSNHVLTFTYIKAVLNTLASQMGFKAKAGFKSTDKTASGPVAAMKRIGSNAVAALSRVGSGQLPVSAPPSATAGPRPGAFVPGSGGLEVQRSLSSPRAVAPRPRYVRPPPEATKRRHRRGCWAWVNVKTLEGALDPIFLFLSLGISVSAIVVGVYKAIANKTFNFEVGGFDDFVSIFEDGRLDVYTLVPMLWALYNCTPPLLFFVYFFTKGRILMLMAVVMQVLSLFASVAALVCLWLWYLSQPCPLQPFTITC